MKMPTDKPERAKFYSRQLIANYDKYFKQIYKHQYKIIAVNNHYFDRIYFFMQDQRTGDKLVYSHDLMDMPRDREMYDMVMADFRVHSKMRIEYRNTHNLVYPGRTNDHDTVHGHGQSTSYHSHSR